MKLNRKQIRALIMEELSVTNRRKPINESILGGLGIAALATLAIAGMTGLQYLVLEVCLFLNIEIVKFNTWILGPLLYLENLRTGQRFEVDYEIDSEISRTIENEYL